MSAQLPPAALDDLFALATHSYIFLIGGGGKTTLMFALADHLSRAGRTVVTTTSTKILYPEPDQSPHVIVEADVQRTVARLRSELPQAQHITLGKTRCDADRKLSGYTADELDSLRQAHVADYLLVEADGAAGRSFKAHADHEPVVSTRADLVIAVVGTDCVGCPLDDAHVHRAARFAELSGRNLGTPLTVDDVSAIFFHPQGYLQAVPDAADVIVLLGKAGSDSPRASARQLAAALHAADRHRRIARIVLGELVGPQPFLEPAD